MTAGERKRMRERVMRLVRKARIVFRPDEIKGMEFVEFGLRDFERTGLSIVVYENNARYCAKELVLLPRQTCAEHRHPPRRGNPGKMETFRCRWGEVYLYMPGPVTRRRKANPPKGDEKYYTVFHEVVLKPGEQLTLPRNTRHWFQGGPAGAVVSEFSSESDDASDVFSDPRIRRVPD